MITFKCSGCARSFSLRDKFAGMKTKCPTCGAPLSVPAAVPGSTAVVPTLPAKMVPSLPAVIKPPPPVEVVGYVIPSRPAVDYKDCPFCEEQVIATAKKCKHCGETLDVAMRSADEAKRMAILASRGGGGSAAANTTVIIQESKREQIFPHAFHLLCTILTCGFWAPIWLLHYLLRGL